MPQQDQPKFIISEALESDLPEILNLQKISFQSEADLYNDQYIQPMTQTLNEIREEFSGQTFLKAIKNDKIVGSARGFLKDGTGYINKVIVDPNFQNQGLGRQLMAAMEALLRPANRYELFTGNRSVKNLAFYQKLGYILTDRRPARENPHLVCMEKTALKH